MMISRRPWSLRVSHTHPAHPHRVAHRMTHGRDHPHVHGRAHRRPHLHWGHLAGTGTLSVPTTPAPTPTAPAWPTVVAVASIAACITLLALAAVTTILVATPAVTVPPAVAAPSSVLSAQLGLLSSLLFKFEHDLCLDHGRGLSRRGWGVRKSRRRLSNHVDEELIVVVVLDCWHRGHSRRPRFRNLERGFDNLKHRRNGLTVC